jgi:hypothetical protein
MNHSVRTLGRFLGVVLVVAALGCGGDDPPRKPDTGAGAGQTPPAVPTCTDLCARLGDCVEILCNEDTKSTQFTGFGDLIAANCVAGCTDAALQTVTASWNCLFQSSCRQVFDYDTCNNDGSYHCM